MRLILDTHTLIWAVDNPTRMGRKAIVALQSSENELLLSAGSVWEVAIKVGLAKLALSLPFRDWMQRAISDLGATVLPITVECADVQRALPAHHGDPFDRLIAAQSKVENAPVVSKDPIFDQYDIRRIW